MKIWMVNPYGTYRGEPWREHRTSLAASALAEAGHDVLWWLSAFQHRSKTPRCLVPTRVDVAPRYRIELLPGPGYTGHVSFARINHERDYARQIFERAEREERPDLIIIGEPALFTSGPILALAKRWNIPIILDVADLWPELFDIVLPKPLRWAGRFVFAPLYWRRAALVRRSAAVIAVTNDYREHFSRIAPSLPTTTIYWGVDVDEVRRDLTADTSVPAAVATRVRQPGELWAIYAGTLGPNYDIATILAAAERLRAADAKVTILIAGDGVLRSVVEERIASAGLTNCLFLGSLPATTITKLYTMCQVGLASYVRDSTVSMPIKAFDYFAAGLPIVNSLGRDLGGFVHDHDTGVTYAAEDPQSLADALQRLSEQPEALARMAANAHTLGEEFSVRTQYGKFVAFVEQVMAGAPRSPRSAAR
jgi:glycosyltransferase involved in cell wall biosynthesis